jgi:hypothetical protein
MLCSSPVIKGLQYANGFSSPLPCAPSSDNLPSTPANMSSDKYIVHDEKKNRKSRRLHRTQYPPPPSTVSKLLYDIISVRVCRRRVLLLPVALIVSSCRSLVALFSRLQIVLTSLVLCPRVVLYMSPTYLPYYILMS